MKKKKSFLLCSGSVLCCTRWGNTWFPFNLSSIPNMDTSFFEFQPAVKYIEESNLKLH